MKFLKRLRCFVLRCNKIRLTQEEMFLSRATSLEDLDRLQQIWNRSHK